MDRPIIRPTWTFQSTEIPSMSPATAIDIEDLPAHFVGVMDKFAGKEATSRAIGTGTCENIRRGRRKSIGVKLYERIRAATIRALETRRRQIDAEIHLALQSGVGAGDERLLAAAAALVQVEEILKEAVK